MAGVSHGFYRLNVSRPFQPVHSSEVYHQTARSVSLWLLDNPLPHLYVDRKLSVTLSLLDSVRSFECAQDAHLLYEDSLLRGNDVHG